MPLSVHWKGSLHVVLLTHCHLLVTKEDAGSTETTHSLLKNQSSASLNSSIFPLTACPPVAKKMHSFQSLFLNVSRLAIWEKHVHHEHREEMSSGEVLRSPFQSNLSIAWKGIFLFSLGKCFHFCPSVWCQDHMMRSVAVRGRLERLPGVFFRRASPAS